MKKKFLSLFIVMVIAIVQFAPAHASALNYELSDGDIVNSYNITTDEVTLYVGNISVNGTSTIKYLYTDKSVDVATLTEMRKILPSDYASLLPTTAGQVAVSNDSSVTVNDLFTDAGMIAINKYATGTVEDASSTILYDQTTFSSLASTSATEITDETTAELDNESAWNTRKSDWETNEQNKANADANYTMVEFPEEYVSAFDDSTVYPTESYMIVDSVGDKTTGYIIKNGVATQVDTYPVNRTIIKVVNTSADVTMSETLTSITGANVILKAPKVGDKVEKVTKNDGYGDYEAQSSYPTVSTTTEGLTVNAYWVQGLQELSEESFYGTFEEDTYYYVLIDFEAEEGYELPSTFPDGIKINGNSPDEVFAVMGGKWNHCIAKIKATTAEEDNSTDDTYTILEGGNQTYIIGSNKTITIKASGDLEKVIAIEIDNGNVIDPSNYELESGSTILTFKTAFLENSSIGKHTITIKYNDGEVETKLTIANATDEATTTSNPQTGDSILFYVSVLGFSFIGFVAAGIYIKKKMIN